MHKHYESGNIPRLQQKAVSEGVVWLMINSGAPGNQGSDYTASQIDDWLKQYHAAPTAYLRDSSGEVGHLYGAKTTPHLFIIRADGVLAYEGGIDSIRSAGEIQRHSPGGKLCLRGAGFGREGRAGRQEQHPALRVQRQMRPSPGSRELA